MGIFIIFFRFVLRFRVVMNNSMVLIRLILVILGLAKLPLYGLHIWLPKVHVEASIVRSMVLAGAVLKLGILYCWNFSLMIIVRLLVLISAVVIISVIDGKRFAAYSSVLHMSLCVIFGLVLILLVGYTYCIITVNIHNCIYRVCG